MTNIYIYRLLQNGKRLPGNTYGMRNLIVTKMVILAIAILLAAAVAANKPPPPPLPYTSTRGLDPGHLSPSPSPSPLLFQLDNYPRPANGKLLHCADKADKICLRVLLFQTAHGYMKCVAEKMKKCLED